LCWYSLFACRIFLAHNLRHHNNHACTGLVRFDECSRTSLATALDSPMGCNEWSAKIEFILDLFCHLSFAHPKSFAAPHFSCNSTHTDTHTD
jgi:hypothetical protein